MQDKIAKFEGLFIVDWNLYSLICMISRISTISPLKDICKILEICKMWSFWKHATIEEKEERKRCVLFYQISI